MNNFKEKLLIFFNNLKNWFKKHNDKLAKFFNWVFGFYVGVVCCFLSGYSLINFNTASASSINKQVETISLTANSTTAFNYDISSDYFRFEIGETSLAYFSNASQSGYPSSTVTESASLYTNIEIDTSFDNAFQYTIGFGTFDSPITNLNNRWVRYHPTVSFMTNTNYNTNYVNYGHSVYVDIGSRNVELLNSYFIRTDGTTQGIFGYEFPIVARTLSSGANGTTDNDWLTVDHSTYYFISSNALNQNIARTSLVSYSIAYKDMSYLQSTTGFFGSYVFGLPVMKVHLFEFDNGDVFAYGYSTIGRYKPLDGLPHNQITTYYFSSDNYDVGYQLGKQDGYELGRYEGETIGYNKGISESLDSVSPFNFIKDSISRFFQIRLFGDLSIGHILSLGFGLMLIGLIIKILLGG